MFRIVCAALLAALALADQVVAQSQPPSPQPFPRPGEPARRGEPAVPRSPAPGTTAPAQTGSPTEATLGLPIYPGAQFIASYDAGQGQRYYLFGTSAGFGDLVAYYKAILKQKGGLVFDAPAVHMFEVGRFREDAMAFPPGVTVKDYTWGGSEGYLNPKPGGQPARFRTIIQIVPLPPAGPG